MMNKDSMDYLLPRREALSRTIWFLVFVSGWFGGHFFADIEHHSQIAFTVLNGFFFIATFILLLLFILNRWHIENKIEKYQNAR